jgi:4a-hydroxytetrahydrobiopterin dehydratase
MASLLHEDALRDALTEALPGWTGTVEGGIEKVYELGDFTGSVRFVNAVAAIANRLNHHPDIQISWGTVTLRIISHAKGGVTDTCVELARLIDAEQP